MNYPLVEEAAVGISKAFAYIPPVNSELTEDEWNKAFALFLEHKELLNTANRILAYPAEIANTPESVIKDIVACQTIPVNVSYNIRALWNAHHNTGHRPPVADCRRDRLMVEAERLKPIPTHIYLMQSGCGKYYKIGHSKQPRVRETTLQAEQPSLRLIGCWDGYKQTERRLHIHFAKQRVRGEWFALDAETVADFGYHVGVENNMVEHDYAFIIWDNNL